jgi:hypothetical protein
MDRKRPPPPPTHDNNGDASPVFIISPMTPDKHTFSPYVESSTTRSDPPIEKTAITTADDDDDNDEAIAAAVATAATTITTTTAPTVYVHILLDGVLAPTDSCTTFNTATNDDDHHHHHRHHRSATPSSAGAGALVTIISTPPPPPPSQPSHHRRTHHNDSTTTTTATQQHSPKNPTIIKSYRIRQYFSTTTRTLTTGVVSSKKGIGDTRTNGDAASTTTTNTASSTTTNTATTKDNTPTPTTTTTTFNRYTIYYVALSAALRVVLKHMQDIQPTPSSSLSLNVAKGSPIASSSSLSKRHFRTNRRNCVIGTAADRTATTTERERPPYRFQTKTYRLRQQQQQQQWKYPPLPLPVTLPIPPRLPSLSPSQRPSRPYYKIQKLQIEGSCHHFILDTMQFLSYYPITTLAEFTQRHHTMDPILQQQFDTCHVLLRQLSYYYSDYDNNNSKNAAAAADDDNDDGTSSSTIRNTNTIRSWNQVESQWNVIPHGACVTFILWTLFHNVYDSTSSHESYVCTDFYVRSIVPRSDPGTKIMDDNLGRLSYSVSSITDHYSPLIAV